MHEAVIAQNIIRIVREALVKNGVQGRPVERITIRVGQLDPVVPEALEFHFRALAKSHSALTRASLEITVQSIHAKCKSCGRGFEVKQPPFACPACSGPAQVVSGQGLWVEGVRMAD